MGTIDPTSEPSDDVELKKAKYSNNSSDEGECDILMSNLYGEIDEVLCDNEGNLETDNTMNDRQNKMVTAKQFASHPPIPHMMTYTLETESSCIHTVSCPPHSDRVKLNPPSDLPAKEYPFKLDAFQRESILCVDNDQSVLVSAHTSAGKTVIAEYAIALSLRRRQRVIYTTPIKALSNQKYREFLEEFEDVGLMTGDITINPDASCLIMTTEILRSMLYRGSEIMREMAWVIFDEIHYMRDKERGVVWEETIILLPDKVHYVFLSATIPNAKQFAEWITYLHKEPCHVVYTEYRPTPLQHFLFPAGGERIMMVCNEEGKFNEAEFNEAMAIIKDGDGNNEGDKKGRKGQFKDQSNCYKIVRMIMERNLAPAIIFSFSKKDCEAYATQMSRLDFNTETEKKLVDKVFNNAVDSLSEEDRLLPQVTKLLPLLRKGIGIHHSGLLPILKEVVEILFGEGLIKALFATETFAMGLNMPARTVVFTNARKFDGKDFRFISSGEYIQMSGRAGRRGLDDKGIVILMVDEKMSPEVGRNLLRGSPDQLNSAFQLTYSMVLNLIRVEEINPEYIMERSFHQFQNYHCIPEMVNKFQALQKNMNAIPIENEEQMHSHYVQTLYLKNLKEAQRKIITSPKNLLPFMKPGRLVHVVAKDKDFGWGMAIDFEKNSDIDVDSSDIKYYITVILNVKNNSAKPKTIEDVLPSKLEPDIGTMQAIAVPNGMIVEFSTIRMYFNEDLTKESHRKDIKLSILEIYKRIGEIPILDPEEEMKISDQEFHRNIKKIKKIEHNISVHEVLSDEKLKSQIEDYKKKEKFLQEMEALNSTMLEKQDLLKMDDLVSRKNVLNELNYASLQEIIQTKGIAACEIGCADVLVIIELLFNGSFNNLTASECAGLLSVFVLQEKSKDKVDLKESIKGPLRDLQNIVKNIAEISNKSNLLVDVDDYSESFRPQMINIVDMWCQGSSFASIIEMTDIFEGSVVRCMRRLEELLREMVGAAKSIGNNELEIKFSEAIKLLKRDIVFAASLYF